MARILIFGGHGKVALLLEPMLVAQGHTVTAVIRDSAQEAEVAATGAAVLSSVEDTAGRSRQSRRFRDGGRVFSYRTHSAHAGRLREREGVPAMPPQPIHAADYGAALSGPHCRAGRHRALPAGDPGRGKEGFAATVTIGPR